MFYHRKELFRPVSVGTPDAQFGQYLLEQFGGATGELTAALQYWVQSFHVENAAIRDMLQDIAIEEFNHLEMVGKLIALHTAKIDQTEVYDAPLFQIKGGGPHFLDSHGCAWTASYIQEGGNVVRDLRANISAEAGARQTYEALIKRTTDEGTKATLTHLLTRNYPRQYVHEGAGCDG
jgi:Mn-containing catalase